MSDHLWSNGSVFLDNISMAILSGIPAMSSIVMMAENAGSEGDYAVGGIFVTAICANVTLPFVSWVITVL